MFNEYQGHPSNNIDKIDSSGKVEIQDFTTRGPDSSHISGNGLQLISHILPSVFGVYYVVGDFLKRYNKPNQPIVCLKDLIVGLAENKQNRNKLKVEVYPNPAKEQINLRFAEVSDFQQIKVYDLLGREQGVKIDKLNDYQYSLNVSQLESGIYFLTIEMQDGSEKTAKVLKQ